MNKLDPRCPARFFDFGVSVGVTSLWSFGLDGGGTIHVPVTVVISLDAAADDNDNDAADDADPCFWSLFCSNGPDPNSGAMAEAGASSLCLYVTAA